MQSPTKITYELTPEMYERIKADAVQVAENNILNRYATRVVDVKAAAQILGVSEDTVRSYVGVGRLQAEARSENGKMRFRLSYLLSIDITNLKYKRQ